MSPVLVEGVGVNLEAMTVKALRELATGEDVGTLTKAQLIERIRSFDVIRIERGDGWEMRLGRWQDSPVEACDHVISDPPYDAKTHEGIRRIQTIDGTSTVIACDVSFSTLNPNEIAASLLSIASRWVLCFCSAEMLGDYKRASGDGWVRAGFWRKTNAQPQLSGDRPAVPGEAIAIMHRAGAKRWNGGGRPAWWAHGLCQEPDRFHETQKPLALMRELVGDFTDFGDLVWDPYAGSATTGVACLQLGRRFVGHEMQEHYFDAACERLRAAERGQTLTQYRAGQEVLL